MKLYIVSIVSFVFFISCQPRKTKEVFKSLECPDRIVLNFIGAGYDFYRKKGIIELKEESQIRKFCELGKKMDGPISKNLQSSHFDVFIFYCNGDDVFFKFKLIYVDGKYVYPINQFKSFVNNDLTIYIDSLLKFDKIKNYESRIDQSIYKEQINPDAFRNAIEIDLEKYGPF